MPIVESYNRYLQGESGALEQLVEELGDALVRYAYCFVHDSAAAEDIAEDCFVALLLKPKQFREDAPLRAYLYRAVKHRCLDYLKRQRRYTRLNDLENVVRSELTEERIVESIDNSALYRELQSLPEQYREALCLHYFEGYSPEEIAEILDKNIKQVYNLLARAKKTLSDHLSKDGTV